MRIKHSKYKNTGLIFELLVKQVTADTLNKKDSPAVKIIKKHFTGKSALTREFKLYNYISNKSKLSTQKAETILETVLEIAQKQDKKLLQSQKYELVRDIKEHYNVDEFFSIKTPNYKALAAVYCLMEGHREKDQSELDPGFVIENKTTVLEYLTDEVNTVKNPQEKRIQEYSSYDKDLKILTFKILLEKFNDKYKTLLPEQKNILRSYITSVDSTKLLRKVFNEEIKKVKKVLGEEKEKISDKVTKIKVEEIYKTLREVKLTEKVTEKNLINILQYYELVKELRSV